MNSDTQLHEMFLRLAQALPADAAQVDSVIRRIEQSRPTAVPARKRNWILRTTIGAAACAVAGVVVWLVAFLTLTPAITLAQVEAAVALQKWMHVKYDNGRECWTTLDGARQFDKGPGGVVTFHDWVNNVRLDYFPREREISRTSAYFTLGAPSAQKPPAWKPKTVSQILHFSMDLPEGEATAKQKQQNGYTERRADTIDGRHLVRFDWYAKDALGHFLLTTQLWVDPLTRLPVRAQYLQQLGERNDPNQKYSLGLYDFPTEGPASIYDLGAPRDLEVVDPNATPQDVAKVIEPSQKACDRFPTRFRLILWSNDDPSDSIYVVYRDGGPKRESGRFDGRGVRARVSCYFNLDKDHPAHHLPLPATAEQILAWTQTQAPVGLKMSDGQRSFDQHRATRRGPLRLEVRSTVSFIETSDHFPTSYQWPIANTSGPFAFLKDGTESKPGLIAIRADGSSHRWDYYIDPKRDYICLNQVWWEKVAGKWAKEREYQLLDLKQLPQGQWYATKQHLRIYGSPERKTGGQEITENFDLRLLDEKDFPPDVFNGDTLLQKAKQEGAVIETY